MLVLLEYLAHLGLDHFGLDHFGLDTDHQRTI